MIIECVCLVFVKIALKSEFLNFSPETAWRATHSRQAAHASLVCFWFPEEPLGGESLYCQAPRTYNSVSGFCDELPGGDEHPPGDVNLFI